MNSRTGFFKIRKRWKMIGIAILLFVVCMSLIIFWLRQNHLKAQGVVYGKNALNRLVNDAECWLEHAVAFWKEQCKQ